MSRLITLFVVSLLALSFAISAQTIKNPKLAPADLSTAQSVVSEVGREGAELTYATRIDAAQKGSYDTLVIIYAKPGKNGKDYFGLVARGDQKYPLKIDKFGRAIKSGDKFLRMGIRHVEGQAPMLRLMASTTEAGKGEMQRNVDYQFDGQNFALISQSISPLAK